MSESASSEAIGSSDRHQYPEKDWQGVETVLVTDNYRKLFIPFSNIEYRSRYNRGSSSHYLKEYFFNSAGEPRVSRVDNLHKESNFREVIIVAMQDVTTVQYCVDRAKGRRRTSVYFDYGPDAGNPFTAHTDWVGFSVRESFVRPRSVIPQLSFDTKFLPRNSPVNINIQSPDIDFYSDVRLDASPDDIWELPQFIGTFSIFFREKHDWSRRLVNKQRDKRVWEIKDPAGECIFYFSIEIDGGKKLEATQTHIETGIKRSLEADIPKMSRLRELESIARSEAVENDDGKMTAVWERFGSEFGVGVGMQYPPESLNAHLKGFIKKQI